MTENRQVEGDQIVISGVHGMLTSFTVAVMLAPSSQVRLKLFFFFFLLFVTFLQLGRV